MATESTMLTGILQVIDALKQSILLLNNEEGDDLLDKLSSYIKIILLSGDKDIVDTVRRLGWNDSRFNSLTSKQRKELSTIFSAYLVFIYNQGDEFFEESDEKKEERDKKKRKYTNYSTISFLSKETLANHHIIRLESGLASTEVIRDCINQAMEEASRRLNKPVKTSFKVNVVADATGKKFGYSYVWFDDVSVTYMILGLNPDGTPRHQIVEAEDWVCPERPEVEPKFDSWGDIMDYEDQFIRPTRLVQLESLMPLPTYKIKPEEIDILYELKVETAKWNGVWTEDMIIPKTDIGTLVATPVELSEPKEGYIMNVLSTSHVPPWLDEKDVKALFLPFVSDKEKYFVYHDRTESYPLVYINRKAKILKVTFDRDSDDARYAYLMMRKTDFVKGSQSCTLFFNYEKAKPK